MSTVISEHDYRGFKFVIAGEPGLWLAYVKLSDRWLGCAEHRLRHDAEKIGMARIDEMLGHSDDVVIETPN